MVKVIVPQNKVNNLHIQPHWKENARNETPSKNIKLSNIQSPLKNKGFGQSNVHKISIHTFNSKKFKNDVEMRKTGDQFYSQRNSPVNGSEI